MRYGHGRSAERGFGGRLSRCAAEWLWRNHAGEEADDTCSNQSATIVCHRRQSQGSLDGLAVYGGQVSKVHVARSAAGQIWQRYRTPNFLPQHAFLLRRLKRGDRGNRSHQNALLRLVDLAVMRHDDGKRCLSCGYEACPVVPGDRDIRFGPAREAAAQVCMSQVPHRVIDSTLRQSFNDITLAETRRKFS